MADVVLWQGEYIPLNLVAVVVETAEFNGLLTIYGEETVWVQQEAVPYMRKIRVATKQELAPIPF